jgi:hypothetical protein
MKRRVFYFFLILLYLLDIITTKKFRFHKYKNMNKEFINAYFNPADITNYKLMDGLLNTHRSIVPRETFAKINSASRLYNMNSTKNNNNDQIQNQNQNLLTSATPNGFYQNY